MYIRKVQLEPFGRFTRLACEFKPGLNVVLGANEAGKTTLINAIHAALFIPPGVRRNSRDWKELISRYLPHPGGDTARVMLELAGTGGKDSFRLRCAWGAEGEVRLFMAGGIEIADSSRVYKKLKGLLRYGRGTYERVFLARQAELIETLDRIKEDRESLSTLADMLRTVVFQSGGISVDELESRLTQELESLESNWEYERDGPRGGRDIDRPHRQRVGQILEQYYRVRKLQQQLGEAERAEEAFESALEQHQKIELAYKQLESTEREMKKLESDMSRRNALEPQLENNNLKQGQLKKIMADWPRVKERINSLVESKERLGREREQLGKELAESQTEQELKKKRAIYSTARDLKKKMLKDKEKLEGLPPVTPEKMKELEQKEKELAGLKAEIGGMKLKINLKTRKPFTVKIKQGLDKEETLLVEGERTFEAQGRFNLEAADWSVEVQSGIKDVEALLLRIGKLEGGIKADLGELGLTGVDQAREIRQKAVALEGEIRALGGRLKDALKGHPFELLEKELAEAGEEKAVRDPLAISTAIKEKELELRNLEKEKSEQEDLLKSWQKEYESYDRLLETVVELKGKGNAMEEELEKLAPLPEKYSKAEDFLKELRELRERKEDLGEELFACRERKIRAESNMPEESPEEIRAALGDAEKRLQALKSEARALRGVKREFDRLKRELDSDTFSPFQELFLEYLAPLTGSRYRHAQMRGALPEGIAREAGVEPLPLELLSYGTISGVALALRLTMARYLLKENEGFIVMDDPLVDLDLERREQAVQILQKAAKRKQIIITTFDLNTASLLGGHQVEISSGNEDDGW